LYKANTTRQQQRGRTTGNDFDLSIDGAYPRDLNFTTENVAFFAENQFRVTEKFSVTPAFVEHITSVGQGRFGFHKETTFYASRNISEK
jgi:Fe(3+) dicitrate transport protein